MAGGLFGRSYLDVTPYKRGANTVADGQPITDPAVLQEYQALMARRALPEKHGLDRLRANMEITGAQMTGMTVGGLFGQIANATQATMPALAPGITAGAAQGTQAINDWAQRFAQKREFSNIGYGDHVVRGIASLGMFMGTAAASSLLAGPEGALWITSALEAMTEQGGVIQELMRQGKSFQDAQVQSQPVFVANLALNRFLDAGQIRKILPEADNVFYQGLKQLKGRPADQAMYLLKGLAPEAAKEGLQEGSQEAISGGATGGVDLGNVGLSAAVGATIGWMPGAARSVPAFMPGQAPPPAGPGPLEGTPAQREMAPVTGPFTTPPPGMGWETSTPPTKPAGPPPPPAALQYDPQSGQYGPAAPAQPMPPTSLPYDPGSGQYGQAMPAPAMPPKVPPQAPLPMFSPLQADPSTGHYVDPGRGFYGQGDQGPPPAPPAAPGQPPRRANLLYDAGGMINAPGAGQTPEQAPTPEWARPGEFFLKSSRMAVQEFKDKKPKTIGEFMGLLKKHQVSDRELRFTGELEGLKRRIATRAESAIFRIFGDHAMEPPPAVQQLWQNAVDLAGTISDHRVSLDEFFKRLTAGVDEKELRSVKLGDVLRISYDDLVDAGFMDDPKQTAHFKQLGKKLEGAEDDDDSYGRKTEQEIRDEILDGDTPDEVYEEADDDYWSGYSPTMDDIMKVVEQHNLASEVEDAVASRIGLDLSDIDSIVKFLDVDLEEEYGVESADDLDRSDADDLRGRAYEELADQIDSDDYYQFVMDSYESELQDIVLQAAHDDEYRSGWQDYFDEAYSRWVDSAVEDELNAQGGSRGGNDTQYEGYVPLPKVGYTESLAVAPRMRPPFTRGHFNQHPNLTAHSRFVSGEDTQGRKGVVAHEMQSDYADRARTYGTQDEALEDPRTASEKDLDRREITRDRMIASAAKDRRAVDAQKALGVPDRERTDGTMDAENVRYQRRTLADAERDAELLNRARLQDRFRGGGQGWAAARYRPGRLDRPDWIENPMRERRERLGLDRLERRKQKQRQPKKARAARKAERVRQVQDYLDAARDYVAINNASLGFNEDEKPPAGPYSKTQDWARLMIKDLVRTAIARGQRHVFISSGKLQDKIWSYTLGANYKEISWNRIEGTTGILVDFKRADTGQSQTALIDSRDWALYDIFRVFGDRSDQTGRPYFGRRINEYLPAGIVDQIKNNEAGVIENTQFRVGNQGFGKAYDEVFVSELKKVVGRENVFETKIETDYGPYPFVGGYISDELLAEVKTTGLPLLQAVDNSLVPGMANESNPGTGPDANTSLLASRKLKPGQSKWAGSNSLAQMYKGPPDILVWLAQRGGYLRKADHLHGDAPAQRGTVEEMFEGPALKDIDLEVLPVEKLNPTLRALREVMKFFNIEVHGYRHRGAKHAYGLFLSDAVPSYGVGYNGIYIDNEGDPNNSVMNTVFHEYGHYLSKEHPTLYLKFVDAVLKNISVAKAEDAERFMLEQIVMYRWINDKIPTNYPITPVFAAEYGGIAVEEYVNNVMGALGSQRSFWQKLNATIPAEDMREWRRALVHLRNVLAALKAQFLKLFITETTPRERDMLAMMVNIGEVESVLASVIAEVRVREKAGLNTSARAGHWRMSDTQEPIKAAPRIAEVNVPPPGGALFDKPYSAAGEIKAEISDTVEGARRAERQPLRRRLHRLFTALWEENHPLDWELKRLIKESGGDPKAALDVISKDPFLLQRLNNGAIAAADAFIHGGIPAISDPSKKAHAGLASVLDGLTAEQEEDLKIWLIASRLEDQAKQFDVDEAVLAKYRQAKAEVEAKPGAPDYAALGKQITGFSNAVLGWAAKHGLVDPTLVNSLRKLYQHYVPLHDLNEHLERQRGAGKADPRQPSAGLKHSTAVAEGFVPVDPIEAVIRNTHRIVAAVMTNNVNKAIGALAREYPVIGRHTVPQRKAVTATREQLLESAFDELDLNDDWVKGLMQEAGLTAEELQALKTMWLVQHGLGDNTIAYKEGGKWKYLQVDPDLYQYFVQKGLNHIPDPIRWAGKVTRVLRAGITNNPFFIAKNVLRDFVASGVVGKKLPSPTDYAKAIMAVVTQNDLYWKWAAHGGAHTHIFAPDQIGSYVEKLSSLHGTRRGKWKWMAANPRRWWFMVEAGLGASDSISRLAQFSALLDDNVKKVDAGELSMQDAYMDAAFNSRWPSVDFMSMGTWGRVLNMIIPFWNAAMQDMRIVAGAHNPWQRGWKGSATTVARGIMLQTVPTMLWWAWAHKQDWYRDEEDWVKQTSFFWPAPGDDDVMVYVPKPFTVGLLYSSSVQTALDTWYGKDPRAADAFAKEMLKVVPFEPAGWPIAKALIESETNYKFYSGGEIVPEYMRQVEPEFRVTPWTSELGKKIAAIPHNQALDGPTFDHFITTCLGTLGKWGLALSDQGIAAIDPKSRKYRAESPKLYGVVPVEVVPFFLQPRTKRRTAAINEFRERAKTANAVVATRNALIRKHLDEPERVRRFIHKHIKELYTASAYQTATTGFNDIYHSVYLINLMPQGQGFLTAAQKRRAIEQRYRDANEFARRAMAEFDGELAKVANWDRIEAEAWADAQAAMQEIQSHMREIAKEQKQ